MVKYTANDLRNMLHKELREYEPTIGHLTSYERKELHKWVADGNSVYCNPHLLYGDDGQPMDYITASRIAGDIVPEDYHPKTVSELCADVGNADLLF